MGAIHTATPLTPCHPVAAALVGALLAMVGMLPLGIWLGRRLADRERRITLDEAVEKRRRSELEPSASAERDALATVCIELVDLVTSPALAARLVEGLRGAGFEAVDATGEPFDPARHRAVERRETRDARLHNVVASTERAGYVGHGRLVRPPEVSVYRRTTSRS